jgi:NAD-reducing hydrogenase large subunit
MNLAQIVQSHALSFFYLSSPDLLLGMDADPAKRNMFGVARSPSELARDGIRLRQFGQQIIERLGGKRIHPGLGGARRRQRAAFPDGIYRVGPLARLNVVDRCGTPRADQELAEFHELQRGPCSVRFITITRA